MRLAEAFSLVSKAFQAAMLLMNITSRLALEDLPSCSLAHTSIGIRIPARSWSPPSWRTEAVHCNIVTEFIRASGLPR
jgi:hypothetical protein